MTLRVEAGFDIAEIGTIGMHVTEQPGADAYLVNITTGKYAHTDLTSILGSGNYDDIATAINTQLTAGAVNVGTWTVVWNGTAYVITASGGSASSVDLSFSSGGGTAVARQTLGYSGNKTGALTYTSDYTPYYVIHTAGGGPTYGTGTDEYEPDGVTNAAESDDGSQYVVARSTAPLYRDFGIRLETKAATRLRSAATAVPWTWQHFWTHGAGRGTEPMFIVDSAADSIVAHQRPARSAFHPTRSFADWDGLYDLEFAVIIDGYI